MGDKAGVVIVGAGQAGVQAAASLRQGGYAEPVTLIGAEPDAPYQRPPLSKGYMLGDLGPERLPIKPDAFYETQNVTLMTGAEVTGLDRAARAVTLKDGTSRPFDHLILATGAEPRRLPVPGMELPGVLTLRTRADSDAIREALKTAERVVVVGGGYIGLEIAAAARKKGRTVTVLEAAPRLLARVAPPELADFYAEAHRAHGVDVRLDATAAAFIGDGRVEAAALEDGTRIPCELVVVGVGVDPCMTLAAEAGIACANGILADEAGRTDAEGVYAAGDCASAYSTLYDCTMRYESVQNALDAGKTIAAAILGQPLPPAHTPWNWSDQYDLKLQTAGVSAGADRRLIRGTPGDGPFAVFAFKGDRLIACDAVNDAPAFMTARQLIAKGGEVDAARLVDPAVPLKELLSA